MLGNLIVLVELLLVVPIMVIVIGIIIMDPLGGLIGLSLFGLLSWRIVHHWRHGLR